MVDGRNPVVLDDVADVIVYRDDASKTVFYALPAKPRLALDEQGRPQLNLVAYGSQGPSGFTARGGILTLTTALHLTGDESERVRQSLARRLARELPQPDGSPPLTPELRPVEWLSGSVELQIVPGVSATGSPSLYGANQFSYSANLDAKAIGAVLDAWQRRLPDASITYHLTARGGHARATTTTHTMSYDSISVDNAPARSTLEASVRQSSSAASSPEFAFTGPLFPREADPAQFLNRQVF